MSQHPGRDPDRVLVGLMLNERWVRVKVWELDVAKPGAPAPLDVVAEVMERGCTLVGASNIVFAGWPGVRDAALSMLDWCQEQEALHPSAAAILREMIKLPNEVLVLPLPEELW